MVNLLIGNKDTTELDILYQKLANDKDIELKVSILEKIL